jgi:hypothetical protein
MRISTVREFRDQATGLLRSKDPILITRRGRLAGVYLPWSDSAPPLDMKRELFSLLTDEIRRQMRKQKVSEEEVLTDFKSWRKGRREARRGR